MNLPKSIFAFAGVALLSAFLLGWGAVPASAQATGAISGRVTNSSGAGIEGIRVAVYELILPYDLSEVSESFTNANGDYAAVGLGTGQYVVGFFDQGQKYRFEYYNDKQNYLNGDYVAVTDGDVTANINAQLAENIIIHLSQNVYWFEGLQNGAAPQIQTCIVTNTGAGTLNWTATPSVDWVSVTPSSGTGDGTLSLRITRTDLPFGDHQGFVTVSDPNASNSPQVIGVNFKVLGAPPFGAFDAPLDGTTAVSSIPVTGWALDDIGIQSVKIYRGTNETNRIPVGDPVFIEGARPDVEALYPYFPKSNRAGWGYMLLTNMLPNGGNGVFQLMAYAIDTEGHEVLLGTKTITCDNANAVKPFGAIDTPAQGGTASGNAYINFGWALTPMPNSIPTDGSTITVWVDGLPLGHPVYNNYRDDIAALFPGYANSNGAVGYYYLDTTGYSDGVHTIAWSVTDSGGNTDGIGSRYFTILNAAGGTGSAEKLSMRTAAEAFSLSEDLGTPIFARRRMSASSTPEMVMPDADGVTRIVIPEVTRIAIYLDEKDTVENDEEMMRRGLHLSRNIAGSIQNYGDDPEISSSAPYEAYELVGEELRPLPIGASFDSQNGILYWQPGPGFVGDYTIIFIKKDAGAPVRKLIKISIVSR